MGITDLFRPKWKHSDAEVRASAVRSLTSNERETLASIACNDADAAVRRIAIKKLADPQLLSTIARTDADESLRQLAQEKADSLLLAAALAEGDPQASQAALAQLQDPPTIAEVAKNAALESIRQTALEQLTDPRALAEVARHAKDPALRLSALQNLDDQALLRSVVLAEETKEVALAALERLSDREALEAVAKKHRLKSLRSRAQRQLKALGEEAPAPQPSQPAPSEKLQPDQLEQICRTVETLARSTDWSSAAQKIAAAQETWQAIAGEADAALRRRFEAACTDFAARHEKHKVVRAARAEKEEALQRQLAQRVALCEQLEALQSGGDELQQLVDRWQALAPLPEAQQAVIEQRFTNARQALERRQAETQLQQTQQAQLEALCAEAEQLASAEKLKPALQKLKELRGRFAELTRRQAAPERLQTRLEQAQRQLEQREAQLAAAREQQLQQNLERQESLSQRAEGLAGSDDLKEVDRVLKEVQATLRKPERLPQKAQEEDLRQRLQAAREQLAARAQELKQTEDWKRWANVPKLEALCEQASALLEEPDLGKAATRLRQLQAEWRKLGAVPKDKSQPLWESFKATCDQVYARCKEHLDQQAEQRQQNLKQKEKLCEQVEALADSSDWEATAEAIKGLQAQWKASGPAPRKQSDAVWKRFRRACDAFFERRKEHLDQLGGARQENLAKKEALCEQVEALAGSSDWEATASAIKGLQAQWKAIGPVPHKQSDAVWKRFRQACDTFFERRKDQQQQELLANLERKEALVAQLEALLGSVPASAEPTAEQASAEQQTPAVDQASPEQQTPAVDQASAEQQTPAVDQASAEQQAPPADQASAEQPAATGSEQVVEAVRAVRGEWKTIGAVPREQSDLIWERFNRACAALALTYPDAFKGSDLDPEANLRRLEQLVRQAESFVEHQPQAPSSAGEAATVEQMAEKLRQALQANAMSASLAKTVDWRLAADELKQLQAELKRLGPVPPEQAAPLIARFRQAGDQVFAHTKEEHRAEDERRQQNLKRKQELCDQAVTLASSSSPAAHLALIESLAREWERIGPPPRGKGKALWSRFRKACSTVRQAANPASEAQTADEAQPAPEANSPSSSPSSAAPADQPKQAAPAEQPAPAAPPEQAAPAEPPEQAAPAEDGSAQRG